MHDEGDPFGGFCREREVKEATFAVSVGSTAWVVRFFCSLEVWHYRGGNGLLTSGFFSAVGKKRCRLLDLALKWRKWVGRVAV